MAARDVPVRARARRSKVGMYAGSLPWGPIPSVLRRQDAATVLIHGCGSSATSCGSVACVVVILSKAREAMRSVCAVSWLKEFGRRTSLFAVRKGRGARGGRADRGRSCPTMPPSVRTSDKTSNQDRIATSMPTSQKKTKLVVVHLNLQRGSGFRLKSVQERNQSMQGDWRQGRAQRKSYEISCVHADPAWMQKGFKNA